MTQLNQPFDPNQHQEMMDFTALPAGEYIARITSSEMKATKNNQGQYLQLEFTVDSPGFQGRKVFTRLNLENQNASAVEIASRELKSICQALGLGTINDSNQLHGKPLIIKLKIDPATGQYAESNSIAAYKSAGNGGQPQGMQLQQNQQENTQQQQGTQQQSVAPADKPAWAG